MSAEIVTPTELFVKVSFTGYSAPFAKAILYDTDNNRIYIQQEVGPEGRFTLEFVLDRKSDQTVNFALFAAYKGLESSRLTYSFSPSTYNIDSTQKIILPPLVDLSSESVKSGEEVRIMGYGCPSCNLAVVIRDQAGTELTYSSITDINGFAQIVLTSGLTTAGDYTITATMTKDAITSAPSNSLLLKVAKGSLTGSYGYLPGAIVIDGIGEFLSSPLGLGILALIMLSAFSLILQSWIQIIELFQKMNIRGWFLPFFLYKRKRKKKEEEQIPPAIYVEPIVPCQEHIANQNGKMYIDDSGPQNLNLPPGDYHIIWQSGGGPPQVDMLQFKPQSPQKTSDGPLDQGKAEQTISPAAKPIPADPISAELRAPVPETTPPLIIPPVENTSRVAEVPAVRKKIMNKRSQGPDALSVPQELTDAMISALDDSIPSTIQHNSFKLKHLNPLYWLWKKK